jgi:large subunit ribosomal protein L13
MKTFTAKNEDLEKKWHIIDAKDKVLGRLATNIAMILMGKNKPIYTPHIDTGDYVIVLNASKIKVTGNKLKDKKYYKHTRYAGGLKVKSLEKMLSSTPENVIKFAVKSMLPKNTLAKKMITKLKIYKDDKHPHMGQNPTEYKA